MKCVEIRTEVTTRNRKNKKISVSKTLSEIKEGTVEWVSKTLSEIKEGTVEWVVNCN